MFRCLTVTVAVVLALSSRAGGTINIWLSGAGSIPPGSMFPTTFPTGVPTLRPYLGSSGTVYIWGRPDTGKFLENISLNLIAETQPCTPCATGAIAFTSVTMYNPSFAGPATRFEFIDDSTSDLDNPLPISANSIEGMAGLTILNEESPEAVGIGSSAEAGTGYYFFDGTEPGWLIASVTYDVLSAGAGTETQLFLEIGRVGLNQSNAMDVSEPSGMADVQFGDATDDILNGDANRETHQGGNYDALISSRRWPGDADGNGVVNSIDFDIWRANFRSTSFPAADHNGNGFVDAADYVIWRKYLGTTAGSGGAGAMGVPEPSAAAMASIAVMALLVAHRPSFGRAKS